MALSWSIFPIFWVKFFPQKIRLCDTQHHMTLQHHVEEHYFSAWSLGNSKITNKKPIFILYKIFYNYNISFFRLRFDLFSIITKEVIQVRNNVVCVVADLVFLFFCAITAGCCNTFQHIFEN